MLPDFNRLRVFFHVCAAQSVSVAAEQLHVTQSAVSQNLAKLEAEVGTPLFMRMHRKLVPTPAGQRLFSIVSPFVEHLRQELAHIERAHRELYGALRVGSPVEFGVHRLPAVFASFRAHHPRVSFSLRLGHPDVLLPLLRQGELDIAVVDMFGAGVQAPRAYAGFELVKVMDEKLILVCAKGYAKKRGLSDPSLADLGTAQYIAYDREAPALRTWFRHHFKRSPGRMDLALTVESVQGVISGIEAGLGLGVVPSHLIDSQLRRGTIVKVGTRGKEMTNRVSLVRVLDKSPSLSEKTFVRSFKDALAPSKAHPSAS